MATLMFTMAVFFVGSIIAAKGVNTFFEWFYKKIGEPIDENED